VAQLLMFLGLHLVAPATVAAVRE